MVGVTFMDIRIIICGHLVWFCCFGYIRACTVFQTVLVTHYNRGDSYMGLCNGGLLAGVAVGGILCGYVIPKFGIKWPTRISSMLAPIGFLILALTTSTKNPVLPVVVFALFIGVPLGCSLNTTNRALRDYAAPSRIGLFMILAIAGNTTGASILPHIFNQITEGNSTVYEQAAFNIYVPKIDAIFYALTILMSLLLIAGMLIPEMKSKLHPKEYAVRMSEEAVSLADKQPQQEESEKPELISIRLLRTRPDYTLFVLGHFLFQVGVMVFFLQLSPLLEGFDVPKEEIAKMMSANALVEIVGKAAMGLFLIDHFDKVKLLAASFFGFSVMVACLICAGYFDTLRIYLCYASLALCGFFDSGTGAIIYATMVELMAGSDQYSVALGMHSFLTFGIGSTISPIIGGAVVDAARSSGAEYPYQIVYVFANICIILAVVCLTVLRFRFMSN